MPLKGLTLRELALTGVKVSNSRDKLALTDAWIANNVRSIYGKVESSPGTTNILPLTATDSVTWMLLSFRDDAGTQYLYSLGTKLLEVTEATGVLTDRSRVAGYTVTSGYGWDAIVFQNSILATDVNDILQIQTARSAAFADAGGGAPTGALTLASFMTYVVAAGLVTLTPTDVRKVQWSDAGNAQQWATGDAGNLTIYQDQGAILKALPLGDVLVLYREYSIHILFYVGPPFIFAQRQVIRGHGLVGKRSVADLGRLHIYWATDNVYTFDGASETPVGDAVIDQMTVSFDPVYRHLIHTVHNPRNHEVYFLYVVPGQTSPQKAWVYNYQLKQWRNQSFGTGLITSSATHRSSVSRTYRVPGGGGGTVSMANQLVALLGRQGTNQFAIDFIDDQTTDILGVGIARTYESGLFQPAELLFGAPNSKTSLEYLEVDVEKMAGSPNLTIAIGTVDLVSTDAEITFTSFTVAMDGTTKRVPISLTSTWFTVRITTSAAGAIFRVAQLVLFFNLRGDR